VESVPTRNGSSFGQTGKAVAVLLEFSGRMSEREVPMGNVLSAVRHPMEGVPKQARRR